MAQDSHSTSASDPSSGNSSLAGRITLITGGSGGLGRGVTRSFVEAGARVHVPVFSDGEVAPFREALGHHADDVELHHDADLTNPDVVDRLLREIRDRSGGDPAILVHLAGGFAMADVTDTEPDTWHRMMGMNATSAFLVARGVFPGMKAAGHGRILTVSALPALDRGARGMSAYGAAKAAVLNFTQTLAREGVAHGITANAILPSIIDTEGNREAMPDAERDHWLDPEAIGRVLRFLASDDGAIVTGAAIPLTLGDG